MDDDEEEQLEEEEEVAETGIDSQVRIDSIIRVPRPDHRIIRSISFWIKRPSYRCAGSNRIVALWEVETLNFARNAVSLIWNVAGVIVYGTCQARVLVVSSHSCF